MRVGTRLGAVSTAPLLWIAVALGAGTASAQPAPSLEEFSVVRFTPAPGPGNYLSTDSTTVGGHLVPSAGLMVDYAHNPFVLYGAFCDAVDPTNCDVTAVDTRLVRYTLTGHIFATLGLFDRVQVGLMVPVAYLESDRFAYTEVISGNIVSVGGGDKGGVGDPRLVAKARLFDTDAGFGLGASAFMTVPLGQVVAEGSYIGEDTVTGGGRIIADFHAAPFHVAANFGGIVRPERVLFSTSVGSEFVYSGALAYDLTQLLTIMAEVQGASSFSADTDENPLEARGALELRQGDFAFTLGGGAGILAGVGMPAFRLLGGLNWAPVHRDQDGDSILDDVDTCPADAEDFDGFQDEDGCPEDDNDGDGRLDGDDPCPLDPEDLDGFEDEDGCPDEDNDKDGIADGYDSCPEDPEDMDGDRDTDGCPDNDRDGDGIPDHRDQCPDEKEDTDGFGDEDGCPEEDFDNDGIPDDGDECPDQPETINGVKDKDGCPEEDKDGDGIPDIVDKCPDEAETMNGKRDDDGCPDGEELARVEGERIVILQQVRFATGRARIQGGESKQILKAVAGILKRNPSYTRVRVEGHTDNVGDADSNRKLSEQRAQACVDALVREGIKRGRLSAVGLGPDKPLAENDTEEGRAQNRRVEFHIENPKAPMNDAPAGETQVAPPDPAPES